MSNAELFQKNKYVQVEGLLDPHLVQFLGSYYKYALDKGIEHFGRDGTSLNGYGEAAADVALYATREKIEKNTGLELMPAFSFVRLYKKGENLRRHLDRGANEINVTIQISGSTPWPLGVEVDGQDVLINQQHGDALIYHGLKLPHWRDEYEGEEHLQLILAYVIKDGENARFSFDGKGGPFYTPGAATLTIKKRLIRFAANVRSWLRGEGRKY